MIKRNISLLLVISVISLFLLPVSAAEKTSVIDPFFYESKIDDGGFSTSDAFGLNRFNTTYDAIRNYKYFAGFGFPLSISGTEDIVISGSVVVDSKAFNPGYTGATLTFTKLYLNYYDYADKNMIEIPLKGTESVKTCSNDFLQAFVSSTQVTFDDNNSGTSPKMDGQQIISFTFLIDGGALQTWRSTGDHYLSNIALEFGTTSILDCFNEFGSNYSIRLNDISCYTDNTAIYDELSAKLSAIISQLSENSSGSGNQLQQINQSIQESISQVKKFQEDQSYMNQVDHLITSRGFNDVKESVSNLQEYIKNDAVKDEQAYLEQESNSKLSKAVDEIVGKVDIDISSIVKGFQDLWSGITTHDTNASLTFPAGKVPVLGEEMTFWEAEEVNFSEYFENDTVQLLLIPLRFLFVFGAGKHIIGKVDQLINLVILEGGGHE